MYISQLAIHGFKSFARKETLKFGEGITAVVGPNGCGKTNIVDAVRWVLGEQKYSTLRGSRTSDVIFNGSDAKKPLNVCEVTLLVHNDKGKLPIDYADVEITRRAFRNGESAYMINRTPCRLKDIHDLFVDTGMGPDAYSVIELKMVEDILSDNTEDCRRMFEEAAGINKYKGQRRSTLNKIEITRADLERVNDIIAEVENQVDALRLQLKRYDRHAVLTKKLKDREVQLAYLRKQRVRRNVEPAKNEISRLQDQHATYVDKEKSHETILEQMKKTYGEKQQELSDLQQKIDELSNERQESRNQILVLNEKNSSIHRTIERLQVERAESLKRIDTHKFNVGELETELANLVPKIDDKRSNYEEQKSKYEHVDRQYHEGERRLEHLISRQLEYLDKLNASRSLQERTSEILDEKVSLLKNLESQSTELESGQTELEKNQKTLEGERKNLEREVSNDRKKLAGLDTKINGLRSQKHDLTLEFHRIANQVEMFESRLQFYKEIIESGEGHPPGVRYILNKSKDYPGVLGVLAELIEVDQKYRPAIEAGLGSFGHSLVCGTRNEAIEILEDLSQNRKGGVTLIPLNNFSVKIESNPVLPDRKGIIGFAADFVKAEKGIEPLIRFLLRDLIIAKDSSTAEALWNTKGFSGNIADLKGRYYDQSGLVTSVNGERELGLLGRRQKIDELDKQVDSHVREGNETQKKMKRVDKRLSDSEEQHHGLSTELSGHIDALADTEKRMTQNEYAISQKIDALKVSTHQTLATRKDILELEKKLDRNLPKLKEMEEQQANFQEKIDLARAELEETKRERQEQNDIIQDIRLALISIENEQDNLGYKIGASNESIKELEQRKVDLSDEIAHLRDQLDQTASQKKEVEVSQRKLTAQHRKELSIKDLKDQAFQEIHEQIDELQREMRNEQKSRETVLEELRRTELQVSDYESQIDLIESRLHEKYEMKLPETLNVKLTEDELSLEIDRIERSIERIGPINMAVKDEFSEENSRLSFLKNQRTDLVESEESLLGTMNRIDTAARTQFLETYEQIRNNYRKTFRLFFEGGEGDLKLRGSDDPLEADIAILARPPGKRTNNLRMLSSGEKALTAIALLFAIYQVKPSPFCILDEVDAPLDDLNIGKFARVLDKFSKETQFIIVTHNKLTMEVAGYLHGVTMEQTGISKIVSVEFD